MNVEKQNEEKRNIKTHTIVFFFISMLLLLALLPL